MGLLVIIIGLVMVIFAGLANVIHVQLGLLAEFVIGLVGAALIIAGAVMTVMSFYRRAAADQAFVRTGLWGSKVVLDGGTTVLPFFHRVLEINLKTMKLGVNPRGTNALITHDNLRANVLAQFYIRVQADQEHILNAARSLGDSSVNAEAVEALVSEKLVSALRAIAISDGPLRDPYQAR
jgi:flotillin